MNLEVFIVVAYAVIVSFLIGYNIYLDYKFNKMIDKYYEDRHKFNLEMLKIKLESKK